MNKDHIKLAAIGAGVVVLLAAVAGVSYQKVSKASVHVAELEEQLASSQAEAAAFRKYTSYLPQAKQSLIDAADTLSTTVEDELTWVERGQRDVSPFKLEANGVLKLSVAYTFGFELTEGKFDIAVADKGLVVRLGATQLLGAPEATVVSAEYPPKSLMVAEAAATEAILQKLAPMLEAQGQALAGNEAARIIVEKKLVDHLRAFFQKQKDVKLVPDIAVSYGATAK